MEHADGKLNTKSIIIIILCISNSNCILSSIASFQIRGKSPEPLQWTVFASVVLEHSIVVKIFA